MDCKLNESLLHSLPPPRLYRRSTLVPSACDSCVSIRVAQRARNAFMNVVVNDRCLQSHGVSIGISKSDPPRRPSIASSHEATCSTSLQYFCRLSLPGAKPSVPTSSPHRTAPHRTAFERCIIRLTSCARNERSGKRERHMW